MPGTSARVVALLSLSVVSPVGSARPQVRLAVCVLALLADAPAAWPQAFEDLHERYTITTWSSRDGLPAGDILAVTQDAAGFLWLGSNEGLVRFDGMSFEIDTALPRELVRALHAGRDGSLWVGFGQGQRIAQIRDGVRRLYGPAEGVGPGLISGIIEDRHGTVWVGSADGLRRFDGDHFVLISEPHGFTAATSLNLDSAGNLLVGTRQGVYRWNATVKAFERLDPFDDGGRGVQGLAEDRQGHVWAADGRVGLRRLGTKPLLPISSQARGIRVLVDQRGGLWLSTTGTGLWRLDPQWQDANPRIGRAPISGGRAVHEDRDGNIWIGTIEGLVRLSERRILEVPSLGTIRAIEATPDGSVWVASADDLVEFEPADGRWRRTQHSFARAPVAAIHASRNGTLWVADAAGLLRVRAGRPSRVVLPAGVPTGGIESLSTSADGRVIWIATRDAGLLRWMPHTTSPPESVPVLAATRLRAVFADSRNRVWLTSQSGRLGLLIGNHSVRWFDSGDGLGMSMSYALHERDGEIWVASLAGLLRYEANGFRAVSPAHHERWSVSTLVEDTEGDFWLGTNYGIAWLTSKELGKWQRDRSHRARYHIFDSSDGLAGRPGMWGGRTSAMSADGQLWFVTGRGLALVEPRRLKRPRPPVAVRLDRVSVDGRTLPPGAQPSLDSRTSRIVIHYSALELSTPDKVRFRYRLDGFDADWIEAGTRRQASYDNLPPRKYQFHVAASLMEGVWTESGPAWEFSVTPVFYEKTSFAVLIGASLLAGVWIFWQLRLRRNRVQFAALLGERVRLSRELHDTLLQSLVGVALQLEAASNSVGDSPARERLMNARRHVEDYIREARLSIWNLRSPQPDAHGLLRRLEDTAERLSVAVPVEVKVTGMPSRMDPTLEANLLHIGQEAILNAAKHANARHVCVEIRCTSSTVTLRVSDDGCGFDSSSLLAGGNGHLGLVSMKERAAQVGGRFALRSRTDAGTVVEVVVPLVRQTEASA